MQGPTRHEAELARDDSGVTAGILQQFAAAVKNMQATPAIRLTPNMRVEIQHSATTTAEVDAIAAGIGAEPAWNPERTHYQAVRDYGPNVSYAVVHITREHMAAYTAHWKGFPGGDAARELTGAAA